jgi:hypothetical protein
MLAVRQGWVENAAYRVAGCTRINREDTMKTSRRKSGKAGPLVEIRKPVRVRAYRGRFRPFESTKFLDPKALKALRKGSIEIGTVEGAGFKQTISAEIREGKVFGYRPLECEGCKPKGARKVARPELKAAMRQVAAALVEGGHVKPMRPMAIRVSRRLGFQIPIGPIIIIIGDPAPGGIFDLCFEWWDGNTLCWWCLIGASGCITFG